MEIEEWEKRYVEAVSNVKGELANVQGVFVAYNSNVDAMKHVRKDDIRKLTSIIGYDQVRERITAYPREINEPADFLARLIIAMRDGKAAEVPTYTSDIHEWLMDNMVFDSARMGGQAGIISNLLANLGVKNVITYVPWLSKEQADYFVDSPNLKHPVIENGKLYLKHPKEAYDPNQKPKINWILEFSKGIRFKCSGEEFVVPRDNRLIISSRPKWLRIDMSPEMYEQLSDIREDIDGAILSGYQMIKEEYDDGTTYKDYVQRAVSVIERLKGCNPQMRLHVEFTSIQDKVIRKALLTEIVKKHVTSLGLDTVEVANALNVLGYEELAYSVINKGENSIVSLYEGAAMLLKELELQRVHIHSLGFYICVVSKDHPLDADAHRQALLFASALAATQAATGNITGIDDIDIGLGVPVYDQGYMDLIELERHLVRNNICSAEDFEDGCISALDHDLIIVPSKVVKDPVATVGIGDAISAGAFIALLAKMPKMNVCRITE
ncbi:ADP-specific phosphofructokinase [Methanolobus sediminis]|uniref:ADP-specific phosphofructokinase n=1 Tax=Methanolobus sediminis TaxID=3072978 RepID=A0AA51UPF8_9EURY|nr:ADP-specific phosphofructokinase [Methanolobus sediminis]WMW25835.1 ADP-specific phosphofructokinase [Methanolobus sediminis]